MIYEIMFVIVTFQSLYIYSPAKSDIHVVEIFAVTLTSYLA